MNISNELTGKYWNGKKIIVSSNSLRFVTDTFVNGAWASAKEEVLLPELHAAKIGRIIRALTL